jgi:hypothetical protein
MSELGESGEGSGSPAVARPGLLKRCWRRGGARLDRIGDGVIGALVVLFSTEGLVWIGLVLVTGGAVFGWVQTPLQGVIRGYAFGVLGRAAPTDALANHLNPLSYGVVCLLGVALVVVCTARRWHRGLRRHTGAALLLVVLVFWVSFMARQQLLVEALVIENSERNNIISFALNVDGYASLLPIVDLPGTGTLLERIQTVYALVGYGWWFAFWGSGLLLASGFVGARGRPGRFAAGWSGIFLLMVILLAGPAVMAEYHRARGEALYGRAQYVEAVERLRKAVAWAPALRENLATQGRIGAALYWLGDRTTPQARLYIAGNLEGQGEFPRAEMELLLAVGGDPEWKLLRRRLVELHASWGVRLFRGVESGAIPHWEQALRLDDRAKHLRYYLAHAYYGLDDRDQSRALARGLELVALTRDRGILADAYQRLGDMHFKAHQDDDARAMYRVSLAMIPLVKQLNLRAQKGLIGL